MMITVKDIHVFCDAIYHIHDYFFAFHLAIMLRWSLMNMIFLIKEFYSLYLILFEEILSNSKNFYFVSKI